MAPANNANKKAANSLVVLSSAAVLAVYAAGYVRTRSAADRFELQAAGRNAGSRPDAEVRLKSEVRPEPEVRHKPETTYEPSPEVRLQPDTTHKPAAVAPPVQVNPSSTTPKTLAESPIAETAPVPAEAPAPVLVAEQKAAEPAIAPVTPPKSEYKDGTYLGWGHCRHGDIQASVVIAGGRIASATISQCLTRYSCSVIEKLPPEVALRQSPDVDTISGATQSGDAFYYAVTDALLQAK
jgi:uncharacterized protein with FMN-binding domain